MGKVHGVKRVFAFCMLTAIVPSFLIITPLYLRHNIFADVTYEVAESDVIAIQDGVSSVFCESHSLHMNTSFNAFQLTGKPRPTKKLRHIRLKKSMILPDDTFEYWGFYLSSGAIVKLKVCSRYNGSRILVVRGGKHLKTCGLLKSNTMKYGAKMDQDHNRVKVIFENAAEVIGVVDNPSVDKNTAAEDLSDDKLEQFQKKKLGNFKLKQQQQMQPKLLPLLMQKENGSDGNLVNSESNNSTKSHHKRHIRRRLFEKREKLNELRTLLNDEEEIYQEHRMLKRDVAPLDTHITHGGNANNETLFSEESSISSFETDLLTCYDGQILLSRGFMPTSLCKDVHFLEHNSNHMQTIHDVATDGYYYYIFYSDNDFYKNDIHTIFDIYKPTYSYANLSKGDDCINQTECKFPISFLHDETVIVEVPTRNGIEHEPNDITLLVSKCHPRMSVYMIFPITALLLILGFAFL